MNVSKFCESSHLPAALIRATIRQCGGFDSFKEMAEDVTNHGADSGFSGFTYYADTVKFAERNKSAILQACRDMASDLGESGAYSMIAGFNCLKDLELSGDAVADTIHNKRSEDYTQVMNALAWFALEEVSRSYCDLSDR